VYRRSGRGRGKVERGRRWDEEKGMEGTGGRRDRAEEGKERKGDRGTKVEF